MRESRRPAFHAYADSLVAHFGWHPLSERCPERQPHRRGVTATLVWVFIIGRNPGSSLFHEGPVTLLDVESRRRIADWRWKIQRQIARRTTSLRVGSRNSNWFGQSRISLSIAGEK